MGANVVKLVNARSPEKWAEMINNAWREQLPSIFETGVLLESSQEEIGYGGWIAMIKDYLPFNRQTAFKLIKISQCAHLRDVSLGKHLPINWTILYDLTKLTDAQFEDGIKSGAINPNMQRKEVAELRGIVPKPSKKKEREERIDKLVTYNDLCGEFAVSLTYAASKLVGEERGGFLQYMRDIINELEASK